MQVLYERCAAVDVGKDVIAVAVRLPGDGPDGRATVKRTFKTFYGTDITGVSGRAMIEALIAGQRDPKVLAGLARGRMKTKHSASLAALDGRFDDHHAELARMLLDQIDALTAQIDTLTARIEQLLAAMPEAQPVDPRRDGPTPGPSIDTVSDTALGAVDRLDEIPGIGPNVAQVILAEIGLDMSRFPTAAHLVSWAKLLTAHHPVRTAHPRRQNRQRQPLPQRCTRRRRRRSRQNQHLPR